MITLLLTAVGSIWLLWVLYVFVMGCYRAHLAGRLVGITKYMALPVVAFGYIMDAVVNLAVASFLFFDPPRELLLTSRLNRYMREATDWRFIMAKYICDNLLDMFDPNGQHCS
jgi:hypothetical protein